jgi:hypothetical protein
MLFCLLAWVATAFGSFGGGDLEVCVMGDMLGMVAAWFWTRGTEERRKMVSRGSGSSSGAFFGVSAGEKIRFCFFQRYSMG